MATLVLSIAGSALGGPIGGAIGAFVGGQIDQQIFAPPDREGPRLTELKVTTSSYGVPVPRHFGRVRTAGSIIWATDLQEASAREGGGKGRPATVTFSYSGSFAVALASRPIADVRRIWADGNLLRGAAGDLKTGGAFRLYRGLGDQRADPLIASAEGAQAPAFRGFAYCVFENLQLADFGNRIPALTFEVVADNGEVQLVDILAPLAPDAAVMRDLTALDGFSDEGGPLAQSLGTINTLYPLALRTDEATLQISDGDAISTPLTVLPEAVVDASGDGFGGVSGRTERARADDTAAPASVRYYDIARDFQPGMQRASVRAAAGRQRVISFPGSLTAGTARMLADGLAARSMNSREQLAYRIAEIDPALRPGDHVAVPGRPGRWRIDAWEWRASGVELELVRLPQRRGVAIATQAGRALSPADIQATPTLLYGFELPWNGEGSADRPAIYAAASSRSAGWRGAALYAANDSGLAPVGATGTRRSVIGTTLSALAPAHTNLLDRHAHVDIALAAADFALDTSTPEALANGANRALIGDEIVQFAQAQHLGGAHWRLSGLLRGRGASEDAAQIGTAARAAFVLLDDRLIALDSTAFASGSQIAAIGLGDDEPVLAVIARAGIHQRPLTPVHPRALYDTAGALHLCWTRRARGQWLWEGTVDVPLGEQSERYETGIGPPENPIMAWETTVPELRFDAASVSAFAADHPGAALWVRQIGTHARSLPLLLGHFPGDSL